jgi:hypothetical protein
MKTYVGVEPEGKGPRYPMDTKVGNPQSRSGRCEIEKSLAPAGYQTPTVKGVARRYTH